MIIVIIRDVNKATDSKAKAITTFPRPGQGQGLTSLVIIA